MKIPGFISAVLLSMTGPTAQAVNWEEFASTVVLELKEPEGIFTCSGVALSDDIILTAAHCVEKASAVRVSEDSGYDANDGQFIAARPAQEGGIVIHPGYNPTASKYLNDLAVVFLTAPLPNPARKIRIPPLAAALPDGLRVERIGYGGRNGANTRTWTDAPLVRFENGAILSGDALSVPGDSGGPVYVRRKAGGQPILMGIHSTVIIDGETRTAAAVDLRAFKSWIEQVTRLTF